jgi:hypothetical protein
MHVQPLHWDRLFGRGDANLKLEGGYGSMLLTGSQSPLKHHLHRAAQNTGRVVESQSD